MLTQLEKKKIAPNKSPLKAKIESSLLKQNSLTSEALLPEESKDLLKEVEISTTSSSIQKTIVQGKINTTEEAIENCKQKIIKTKKDKKTLEAAAFILVRYSVSKKKDLLSKVPMWDKLECMKEQKKDELIHCLNNKGKELDSKRELITKYSILLSALTKTLKKNEAELQSLCAIKSDDVNKVSRIYSIIEEEELDTPINPHQNIWWHTESNTLNVEKFSILKDNNETVDKNLLSYYKGESNKSVTSSSLSTTPATKVNNESEQLSENESFPLHEALATGDENKLAFLLKMGADPNLRNKDEDTPLHFAVLKKSKNIALLLEAGANPALKNNLGNPPLSYALILGNENALKLFLKHDLNLINYTDESNQTLLHYAVNGSYINIVKLLLESGAKANCHDHNMVTPLQIASTLGNACIVELLLKAAPDFVNLGNNNKETPLHFAAMGHNENIVAILLKNKADPNLRNINGLTPLHFGVWENKIMLLLLKAGANPHLENIKGHTPFLYALVVGKENAVQSFLKNNPKSLTLENKNAQMFLPLAAEIGNKNMVALLLQAGGKVNSRSANENTALHFAAEGGRADIAELLLKSGADPNLKNKNEHTPLHIAASKGHKKIITLLLNKGANTSDLQGNNTELPPLGSSPIINEIKKELQNFLHTATIIQGYKKMKENSVFSLLPPSAVKLVLPGQNSEETSINL